MSSKKNSQAALQIMLEFANITGLTNTSVKPPKRYLWTDAFAVCNWIDLYHSLNDQQYMDLAIKLVNQVHNVLGQHRPDDAQKRTGWISGLSESEGKKHPTAGGLRIGKPQNERQPDEAYDSQGEWSQDGQYFHYNTRWMWALKRMFEETNEEKYLQWAVELAKSSHKGFVHSLGGGTKRMYWKMSIDLSRPLVPSMGHHDPLDGLLCYLALQELIPQSGDWPSLDSEIQDMMKICGRQSWSTSDSLGLGGLLMDVHRGLHLLQKDGDQEKQQLLQELINDSRSSLSNFMRFENPLSHPVAYRLAFRELGLSIGLRAMERLDDASVKQFKKLKDLQQPSFADQIEEFWLKSENQSSRNWKGHQEINMVMLATSLCPDGYLGSSREQA